jgi:hypothetical protein
MREELIRYLGGLSSEPNDQSPYRHTLKLQSPETVCLKPVEHQAPVLDSVVLEQLPETGQLEALFS